MGSGYKSHACFDNIKDCSISLFRNFSLAFQYLYYLSQNTLNKLQVNILKKI